MKARNVMSDARRDSRALDLGKDKHPFAPTNNKKRTEGRNVQYVDGKLIRHYK